MMPSLRSLRVPGRDVTRRHTGARATQPPESTAPSRMCPAIYGGTKSSSVAAPASPASPPAGAHATVMHPAALLPPPSSMPFLFSPVDLARSYPAFGGPAASTRPHGHTPARAAFPAPAPSGEAAPASIQAARHAMPQRAIGAGRPGCHGGEIFSRSNLARPSFLGASANLQKENELGGVSSQLLVHLAFSVALLFLPHVLPL